MKTLNIRLVVILLVCGVVFSGTVYFVNAWQVRRTAHFFLHLAEEAKQRAEAADEEEDETKQREAYLEAIKNYGWYVKLRPEDTDALEQFGFLLADVAQEPRVMAQAFALLETALRQDPDRIDVRRRVAEIAIQLGRYSDAKEHLELLRDQLRHGGETQDDPELLELLGRCYVASGEDAAAVDAFQKTIEIAPDRLEAYLRLAAVLQRRLNRAQEADQWIRKLVEANPDSHRAHLFYGGYVVGLRSVNSVDEVRKHPILLEVTVDAFLDWMAEGGLATLKPVDEDPDAAVLAQSRPVVAKALRYALTDLGLALDDADALLRAAQRGTYAEKRKPDVLAQAETKAVEKLRSELEPKDRRALDLAVKHEVVSRALKLSLRALERQESFLVAARRGAARHAMDHAVKALDMEPDDQDALLLAAQCALWKQDHDTARTYARRVIDLYPEDDRGHHTLAEVEWDAGQRQQAIAVLQQGLKATKKNPRLLWETAGKLIDTGKLEEANRVILDLKAKDYPPQREVPPVSVATGYLEARIAYAQGDWRAAVRGFEAVRGGLTAWPELLKQADYHIGMCYRPGRLANNDQRLRALRRALDVDPFFAEARREIAGALMRAGRRDDAVNEYRQLVQLGQATVQNWLSLIRMLVFINMQRQPSERSWDEVNRYLDRLAEGFPDLPPVVALQAQVLSTQGRADEAEKLVLAARDRSPETVQFWSILVVLAQQRGDLDRARAYLEDAERKLGDSVTLRLTRAQYLVRRHGRDAAEELRKLAENADRFSEENQLRLYNDLLLWAKGVGDLDQVEALCERIVALQPENLETWSTLYDLAVRAQDEAGRKRVLKQIRSVEGEGPYWLYAQAVETSLKADAETSEKDRRKYFAQALKRIERIRELRPSWSRAEVLAAGIYDKQGDYEEAMKHYRQAIEMGERNPVAVHRLIELLRQQRRYSEAQRYLPLLAGRQTPYSDDILRWDAEGSVRTGDFARALKLAREAAATSTDFGDYIWLGQILTTVGQRAKQAGHSAEGDKLLDEAETAFRRAAELGKDVPEVWVTLVQFLGTIRQPEDAEQAIQQARDNLPPDRIPLTLAQCYEMIGQLDKAGAMCRQALKTAGGDPKVVAHVAGFYLRTGEIGRAQDQLGRIVSGEVEAELPTLMWARRRLAVVLGYRSSDYRSLQQARRLIDQNLKADPSSKEDQTIKALLLSKDPQLALRKESAKILEGLQSASPAHQYHLAQIYYSQGNWGKASSLMRDLLASHGTNPRYLVTYIGWLLQRDELADAEIWLSRLERIVPEQFVTTNLRAELTFRRGQHDRALKLLTEFVRSPDVRPEDETERLRLVSQALEQFARRLRAAGEDRLAQRFVNDAEEMYRVYVRERPGTELLLAGFLGRQGKLDEALTLVERVWANSNPGVLAQTYFSMLQGGQATKAQLERAERIAQNALKRFDQPVLLLLAMAELRTLQGRYADAEGFYRRVLAKDGKHAVAMNNLAVLLALRGTKLREAMDLISRAIEISGPVAPMLDSRATVHIALNQPDEALSDLQRALTEGETPLRKLHQAQAFAKAGQAEKAVTALARARELGLDPDMLPPLERKAYHDLQTRLR